MKMLRRTAAALALLLLLATVGCSPRDGQSQSEVSLPPVAPEEESVITPPVTPQESEEESSQEEGEASGQEEEEDAAPAMSVDYAELGRLDGTPTGWGWGGPDRDAENRPMSPVVFQKKFAGYGAHFIVPDGKTLYLTFDEGYEYGYTPAILDTLQEKNVKAVFFITGHFAKTQPELVRRMIDEGHTLGNHSDKHPSYPDMPLAEAAKDLMALHDYVKETYGYEMHLFRFPEGKYSEQCLALVQSLGYESVFWSFAHSDFDVNNQPLYIDALTKIEENAHPGGIYLLHAVSKTNAEVLGEAIDLIRAKGIEFSGWDLSNPAQ